MRLVLQIAGATLFGADIRAEADVIGAANQAISAFVSHKMNNLLTAPLWVPTRRNREFRRCKAVLEGVVLRLIESRRRSGTAANDLLDMLLAAQDEESGTSMSDQQLKDEVLILLFAGHDTTAAALSWALHLLSRHPADPGGPARRGVRAPGRAHADGGRLATFAAGDRRLRGDVCGSTRPRRGLARRSPRT